MLLTLFGLGLAADALTIHTVFGVAKRISPKNTHCFSCLTQADIVCIVTAMKKTAERKNLTMPPDWWTAFERAAKAAGQTLSEWIGNAGRKALPPAERKKLSERPAPGRPAKEERDG